MGVSTNGIIAFGVPCEQGTEFPWDEEPYDGDITEWWMAVNGFVDTHHPFDASGKYADGWSENDSRFEEYFKTRRLWIEQHPVPIDLVNYCSNACPMWAICDVDLGTSCRRGYPEDFDPAELVATHEQSAVIKDFMAKWGIEGKGEPRWLLMSYYG